PRAPRGRPAPARDLSSRYAGARTSPLAPGRELRVRLPPPARTRSVAPRNNALRQTRMSARAAPRRLGSAPRPGAGARGRSGLDWLPRQAERPALPPRRGDEGSAPPWRLRPAPDRPRPPRAAARASRTPP